MHYSGLGILVTFFSILNVCKRLLSIPDQTTHTPRPELTMASPVTEEGGTSAASSPFLEKIADTNSPATPQEGTSITTSDTESPSTDSGM